MKRSDATPVLAGRAGHYREFPPCSSLEPHFLCAWSNTLPPGHAGAVAVVPDGCVDLIWIEGRVVVAGPDESVALTMLAPGTTVAGMRFRPGAAAVWLGLPMSEIVGCRVDLCDLWGGRARDIADRVAEVGGPSERLRQLEAGLSRLVPTIAAPRPDMALVFGSLGRTSSGSGIKALCGLLDMSERSLRRQCRAAFGYGPKTLDRILRFQRFLRLARRPGEARLSLLAHEAGYADQAHLAREVQRLSGLSPSMILHQIEG